MSNKHITCTLTTALALLLSPAHGQRATITLEDITQKGTFRAQSVYGLTSMNDGEHYSAYNAMHQVAKFRYATGIEVGVLFNPAEFSPNEDLRTFGGYLLSPTEDKMLVETGNSQIYRHSYTSVNYIYDLKSKTLTPLSRGGAQMNATFSPDGRWVSFVRSNNIYIVNLSTFEETQVTSDGLYNSIINGAADWVYEEEFALTTAMQWSPDSKKLAFYRFDESRVKMFNMTLFEGNLYPRNHTFKYPKAGEANSTVSIHTYDLNAKTTTQMDVGPEADQYIARIFWTANPNQLSMLRLNRLQNRIDIMLADATTGSSSVLYSETNKYYIDEPTDSYLTFTPDGRSFIITSGMDGHKHIYLYGMDGQLIRQLTKGSNEVIAIHGYDAAKRAVYYSAYDNSPLRRAVYRVSTNGGSPVKLSEREGTNRASFSAGFKYYVHFHSSTGTPTLVTLHNSKGKLIRTLEDNAKLKERLAGYDLPTKEFFTFKTSEGVELYGYMVKPSGFSADQKYPVMMYQYSGPGSQTVQDNFKVGWDEYLATLGYIVVCVDGRGTGGRGEAFRKLTYGQMGLYESTDQIEAAKYLQTLPYVQPNRIGIWGWSYGGYMSSLCLFKGADVFKMAIAVAPVTSWRYYDSVYTERFMGLPQDNALGYDSNSPINHVDKLRGKLLIVHGTADDNVHYQNATEMVARLIEANKQFDFFTYPDKNHFINGGNASMHLYTMLTSYVKENL